MHSLEKKPSMCVGGKGEAGYHTEFYLHKLSKNKGSKQDKFMCPSVIRNEGFEIGFTIKQKDKRERFNHNLKRGKKQRWMIE